MGTHPIFESDFDCLTEHKMSDVEMEVTPAEVEQAKLSKKVPNKEKDKFGDVKPVDGKDFIRDAEKVTTRDGHVGLRKKLKTTHQRDQRAARKAKMMELLETAESGSVGTAMKVASQRDIVKQADVQTVQKKFELNLEMGPYKASYDRSGRHLLMAGHMGHVALMDHLTKKLLCEFSTQEQITDGIFMQNEKMLALAQRKWTYVYDNKGIELHCLKQFNNVTKLHYLPHHFLLTSINQTKHLQYLDISLGKVIHQTQVTEDGALSSLTSNPTNGILHIGHYNGTVTLWSPNQPKFVAKMMAHRSNILDCAVTRDGNYMATTSMDSSVKIWDLRNWKCLATHRLPRGASHLAFSQMGKLATAFGNVVELWADAQDPEMCSGPYARHELPTDISSIAFCPYEDVLGLGAKQGFSAILAPGCGEPNPDSYNYNPYQTKKQRAEIEKRMLLEKCPPETIALDSTLLGKLDADRVEELDEEKLMRVGFKPDRKFEVKTKKRGKSKTGNKEVRKRKMREQAMRDSGHLTEKKKEKAEQFKKAKAKDVLARFMKRDV